MKHTRHGTLALSVAALAFAGCNAPWDYGLTPVHTDSATDSQADTDAATDSTDPAADPDAETDGATDADGEAPDCGNGVEEEGEECDNGTANSDTEPDACREDCRDPWCGDGVPDTGEECDDGNTDAGDGCEPGTCEYSCQDESDCADGEDCNGVETCNAGTHACEAGTPPADGFVCLEDPRYICLLADCVQSVCGDGFVDVGGDEFCEPDLDVTCQDDCNWECTGSGDCPSDLEPCNGDEYCDTGLRVCSRTGALDDGIECQSAPRRICVASTCQPSTCGDGYVDSLEGEECEDGNPYPDDGCEPGTCEWTCEIATREADCDDGTPCTDQVCTEATHTCSNPFSAPGAPCGSPADTDCTDPDSCDGGGDCLANDELPLTPCGSSVDTDCTDPDSCDGSGSCLVNHLPGLTDCDDGVFCNGEDWCNDTGDCTGHPGDPCASGPACSDDCDEGADSCDDPAGTACDDGIYCTETDQCDGVGTCIGSVSTCDDGLWCTDDTCNELAMNCDNALSPGACLIGGACLADGDGNPSGMCQICESVASQTEWTDREPSKLGSDVRITNASGDSRNVKLAWTGSELGLAWTDMRDGNSEIYFTRITPAGSRTASDIRITSNGSSSNQPFITWTGSEFGVAWADNRDGNWEVYFARIGASGAKIGSDVRVTDAAGDAGTTPITWSGSGFGVAWHDNRNGGVFNIYFARLDPAGSKIGSDVRVTSAASYDPDIEWTGSQYGLAWEDARGGDSEAYVARVDASGTMIGETRVTNATGESRAVSLAWTGTGFGLAWHDGRDASREIYFAALSPAGAKIGSDARISSVPDESTYPWIAWMVSTYGVAWQESRDGNNEIYFARISASGSVIGIETRITSDTNDSIDPFLAWTGSRLGVTWYDNREGNYEIYYASIGCPMDGIGFAMIPAGTFTMGSPSGEPGRGTNETQHSVTLTHDFEIMTTEVTQDQFFAVLGYRPSSFASCGGNCPVEQVNWHEAAAYTNTLSTASGLPTCYTCTGSGPSVTCSPSGSYTTPYDCPGYRLPTEAEWEYAARAGTITGTYNGTSVLVNCETPNAVLDPIAWFCGNAGSTTHPAGMKAANAWGLFDMLGNVWEWCSDWYDTYPGTVSDPWGPGTGSDRVIRGSSRNNNAGSTRTAYRISPAPGDRYDNLGFRVVRTLP